MTVCVWDSGQRERRYSSAPSTTSVVIPRVTQSNAGEKFRQSPFTEQTNIRQLHCIISQSQRPHWHHRHRQRHHYSINITLSPALSPALTEAFYRCRCATRKLKFFSLLPALLLRLFLSRPTAKGSNRECFLRLLRGFVTGLYNHNNNNNTTVAGCSWCVNRGSGSGSGTGQLLQSEILG